MGGNLVSATTTCKLIELPSMELSHRLAKTHHPPLCLLNVLVTIGGLRSSMRKDDLR